MIKKIISVLIIMILSISVGMASTNKFELMNRIVAEVNSNVITQSELNKRVAITKNMIQKSKMKMPSNRILEAQVLNQMIDELLQLQVAKKTGIRIGQSELNTQLRKIAKANNKSLSDIYNQAKDNGWTIESFRNNIKNQLIVHKLEGRDVASHVSISQEEVDDFIRSHMAHGQAFSQYHLADIFIALPSTPTPKEIRAAKLKAQDVLEQLKKGKNFHELAIAKSTGSQALQGGDMGWKKLAELPGAIANKVVNMNPSGVTEPIRTPNGYHVIKLLGIQRANAPRSMEEAELYVITSRSGGGICCRLFENR